MPEVETSPSLNSTSPKIYGGGRDRDSTPEPNEEGKVLFQDVIHNNHPVTILRDADGHVVYPSYVPPEVVPPSGRTPAAANGHESTKAEEADAGAGSVATPVTFSKPDEDRSPPLQPATADPEFLSSSAARDTETVPASKGSPAKAATDPMSQTKAPVTAASAVQARPGGLKKWQTEESPRKEIASDRRASTLPLEPRRRATNMTYFSRPLWHAKAPSSSSETTGTSESETESSSSDEDGRERRREPRPVGKGKEAGRARKARKKGLLSEDRYGHFRVGNENYSTHGRVSKKDGRLRITVKETANTGYLAKALGAAVKKVVPLGTADEDEKAAEAESSDAEGTGDLRRMSTVDMGPPPKLNIVIMVIGSRGDAQPFLKIGKILKEEYGHRVRIATHPAFREFIEKDSGCEFFSVGGDPSELMAFMVKNPGMIPKLETVRAGDIGRRRAAMAEMFEGFWRACTAVTDDERDTQNLRMMGDRDPFVADAIIANPPSFAHIHCAEALGIPLHLMFTFPYTPTQAFPHPLASIKKSNVDPGYTNWISYPLVEMMVWQGLGDLVNDFRVRTLGLDPVSTLWAPGATYRLHVPVTYLWSPGLVPKPEDWGDEIDVSGFVFLDLASTFKPPEELTKFIEASGDEPLVYIGFGSIVVDDADKFTQMIFDAIKMAGVRALVSKGWGGLGLKDTPDYIYMLENTPHDWLFPKVSACVIHGGAGTTAIALKCGRPTMIVPFFGDQHFWGSMVGRAGAGPEPVPYKDLTAEKLAEGIRQCVAEDCRREAERIARDIELEGDGARNAVGAFHEHLLRRGGRSMRCSILGDHVAVWRLRGTNIKLSALAADIIVEKGCTTWKRLKLVRHEEWNDFEGPGEPVTGAAGSLISSAGEIFSGIGGVPYRIARSRRERKIRREKRRAERARRREAAAAAKAGTVATQNGSAALGGSVVAKTPDGHVVDDKNMASKDFQQFMKSSGHVSKPQASDEKKGEKSMRQANGKATGGSSSGDNDDARSTVTTGSATKVVSRAADFLAQLSDGIAMSAHALARAPVDLSLAVAQGFHNAPRLYGDDTVRRPRRVTGLASGLRAARAEFVYGIYDGWTGLVRLPVRGARSGGLRGFCRGLGMGIGGWVLKDITAIVAPMGYTLKGIAKQIDRSRGASAKVTRQVRRARIVQGGRERMALDLEAEEERGRQMGDGEVQAERAVIRKAADGEERRVDVKRDVDAANRPAADGRAKDKSDVDKAHPPATGQSALRRPATFQLTQSQIGRRSRHRGDSDAAALGRSRRTATYLFRNPAVTKPSLRRLQTEERVLRGWEVLLALGQAIEQRDRAIYPLRSRLRRRLLLLSDEDGKARSAKLTKSANPGIATARELKERAQRTSGRIKLSKALSSADKKLGQTAELPEPPYVSGGALTLTSGAEGAAFESVEIAEKALQALRDGRDIESVVGTKLERRSLEMSVAERKRSRERREGRSKSTKRSSTDDGERRTSPDGKLEDGGEGEKEHGRRSLDFIWGSGHRRSSKITRIDEEEQSDKDEAKPGKEHLSGAATGKLIADGQLTA